MFKVLQIFEPGSDGVFRHVEKLIEFLWQQGVQCDIAFSSRRGSLGLDSLIERIKQRGGIALDLKIGPRPEIGDLGATMRLLRQIRKGNYHVLHAHSSKAGAITRLAMFSVQYVPLFYTPHAYYGLGNGRNKNCYNMVERVLGKLGKTINVSKDEQRFALNTLQIDEARTFVIPNPVDTTRFLEITPAMKMAARAKCGLSESRYVIGYASRYADQKDPVLAYESLAKIAQSRSDVHLLHICKNSLLGDARQFVQEQHLEDRVTFIDYSEDMQTFYNCCDVFLLTSRYEAGWPFVVLEALSCGLPIVTTSCIGMSDIAEAGLSHCYVFPVGSKKDCISMLEAAYERKSDLRTNHRAIIERRFAVDSCFGQIVALYRKSAEVFSGES